MRFCKRSLCHPGNQTIDDALINGIFGGVAGQFRLHHSKVEKRWSGYRYSDCFSWSKGQFWRVCLIIDPSLHKGRDLDRFSSRGRVAAEDQESTILHIRIGLGSAILCGVFPVRVLHLVSQVQLSRRDRRLIVNGLAGLTHRRLSLSSNPLVHTSCTCHYQRYDGEHDKISQPVPPPARRRGLLIIIMGSNPLARLWIRESHGVTFHRLFLSTMFLIGMDPQFFSKQRMSLQKDKLQYLFTGSPGL